MSDRQLDPLILALDAEANGHLAFALERHLRYLAASYSTPPPALQTLAALVLSRARQGQPVSPVEVFTKLGDALGMAQKLLTYAQVAHVLNCSESKVKRLVKAGALASVDLDGLVRVRTADLDAYVESLSVVERGAA